MSVEIIKCLKKILKGVSTLQSVIFNHHTRHEQGGGDEIKIIHGITFNLGVATVGTKLAQALIPGTFTISKVITYGDNAPVGADLKINIKINGASLWDDTDRLIISDGANSGGNSDLDHRDLSEENRLSIDIDQVGSTTPGGDDLLVTIIC